MEQLEKAQPAQTRTSLQKRPSPAAKADLNLDLAPSAPERQQLADQQRRLLLAKTRIERLEQEVAQLKLAVANERQYAYFDALTGLPNRRLLMDRFNQAIARGARLHTRMALLFLDLDGFKCVNDALGHATGDELLMQVARRLNACIRASDTACRYGGDEFVVLLAQIENHEKALLVARKIRAAIAKPYLLQEQVVRVTTSIGMAVYPADGRSYAELIERSDVAMFFDKARCQTPAPFADAATQPPL
jgi:diguanylate cyclase (GGDEF)-like protein